MDLIVAIGRFFLASMFYVWNAIFISVLEEIALIIFRVLVHIYNFLNGRYIFYIFSQLWHCSIKDCRFIYYSLFFIYFNRLCLLIFHLMYIHTYMIGHYNPSVRIIDLVSHTTYVFRVNFIHKWRDLQFKVDSERQVFEKLFMTVF